MNGGFWGYKRRRYMNAPYSRPYRPDWKMVCESCVFGSGQHSKNCLMAQWSKRSREALVVRWNGHKDNLTQYRLETIGVEEVVEFAPDAIPETVHVGQVPSPNRTMKADTNFFEPAKGFPTWLATGPTDLSRFKALFDDVGVKY